MHSNVKYHTYTAEKYFKYYSYDRDVRYRGYEEDSMLRFKYCITLTLMMIAYSDLHDELMLKYYCCIISALTHSFILYPDDTILLVTTDISGDGRLSAQDFNHPVAIIREHLMR